VGNRAVTWTHGFQTVSRGASSVTQPCVRGRGRTLAWPNGGQPVAPKALPTPSAQSPRVCAVSPPADCDPPAGRRLRENSGEAALCLAPRTLPTGSCPARSQVYQVTAKLAVTCVRGLRGTSSPKKDREACGKNIFGESPKW